MLNTITSPTLLIDQSICKNNIQRMSQKAKKHGLKLIPHFKTAQSKAVGKWAKAFDIDEITVSSIKMAAYFTGDGWTNIHIAFPFNPLEIPTLNTLAKHQSLSVQLVNPLVTKKLAEEITQPIGFFIEIDAGYGRTGVEVHNYALIDQILQEAKGSPLLSFKGFYIHAGHSYYRQDIPQIYEETRQALHLLKTRYRQEYSTLVTRTGDTPGCSLMEDFGDIDEIGPGNFVFYDLTQAQIGACQKEDIAVALAVPIVDIQAKKQMILVHGGGVHLSKDFLIEPDGTKNFGEVVKLTEQGWEILSPRSYVKSVSQEHGIIHASQELLASVQVGDILGILPVHSCMTADCMKKYFTLSGQEIDHAEGKLQ
jgi:D-serine deaminase-like pyridoxal phosphate-dependent protein